MADRKQLENALVAAHEAGDTEAAQIIANEIKSLPVAQVPLSDRLSRQAGLTGRYLLEGGLSPVDLLQAPVRGAINLALPKEKQLQPVSAGGSIADVLGLPKPQNTTERLVGDVSRTVAGTGSMIDKAGMFSPTSTIGKGVQEALTSNIPTQLSSAVGGGAGSGIVRELGGGNIAQMIGGLIGGAAGAGVVKPQTTTQSVKQLQNAPRDKVLNQAQDLGYVALPSDVGAGAGSRAMETLSGKYKIQELASSKNQQVTNNLTRKYLGLNESTPLSEQTFNDLRDSLAEPYRAAQDLPAAQVGTTTTKSMATGRTTTTPVFKTGKELVDAIKMARDDSRANWKAFNSGMSGAPTEARNAAIAADNRVNTLENELEKVAIANNQPDLLNALKQARVEIAKVHSVEKVTNPITGAVDARGLAKQLDKNVPISGELKTAAQFAKAFPNVNKVVAEHPNAFSIYDVITGAAGAGAKNLALLGVPALRVAGRYGALSEPIQQRFVKPQYESPTTPFVPYMGLLNTQGQ